MPAPAPAPAAAPMRVLRKRCAGSMSFTRRTFLPLDRQLAPFSCNEMAVLETFKNDPECDFEFISTT